MATIRTFGKEYSYVLKEERDKLKVEQTIWWYKLADLENLFEDTEEIVFQGDITNEKAKNVTTRFKPGSAIKSQASIIRACMVRVESLKNDDGQPVEWPKANRTHQNQFIAALPPTWRAELAGVFRQASTISEDEMGN